MTQAIRILWADDEIDLLRPHIMFLNQKGYEVEVATNGEDALEKLTATAFDLVFLDENMPGLTGLETLTKAKTIRPNTPMIMITKSEEESIMEDAIGQQIADYLIKPVNPHQILTSIKKHLDSKRLITEKVNQNYQIDFRQIAMQLNDRLDESGWQDLYKKLVNHELDLDAATDKQMFEVLQMQKQEANKVFADFVESQYSGWLKGGDGAPVMSHTVFKKWILPEIAAEGTTFLVVIDNLRYDQWKAISKSLSQNFRITKEDMFYSILPTATQYARNALFAGLLPSEIAKRFPQYWVEEEDDEGKNNYEGELLQEQLKRYGKNLKVAYHKITNLNAGKKLSDQFAQLMQNDFVTIVYNFVDMLSHAKSDMQVIKELADDEAAYRSLTNSWFAYSPLRELMQKMAEKGCKVLLTTDHGTVMVRNAVKIVGDKNTNTNLRYKVGKNLNYNAKEVFEVANPQDIYLPRPNVSSRYVFARESDYFVYPNNFNQFVQHFKNTFQHGGISMEEMLVPFVVLSPK